MPPSGPTVPPFISGERMCGEKTLVAALGYTGTLPAPESFTVGCSLRKTRTA
jgi:hypothetical protein